MWFKYSVGHWLQSPYRYHLLSSQHYCGNFQELQNSFHILDTIEMLHNKKALKIFFSNVIFQNTLVFFFYFAFFFFFFLLYNIVLVLSHINMNLPWAYTCSPSWTSLLPPSLYHPSWSSQCTSPKHPVSNLGWWFVSYMMLYMFQSHSSKSSYPLPLLQSPKDCSIHLCLFCCLTYRVIITIFLNSIYMR